MRIVVLAILGFTLAAGHAPSADKKTAEEKKAPTHASQIMQDKLKHSQRLLEALAMGDFAKMISNAEELMQLSKKAEWTAIKTPEYELHTNSFRRAAETIIQKAKAKSVDGAALGYVEMTMTCVRCHQYTRETRMTQLPAPTEPRATLVNR